MTQPNTCPICLHPLSGHFLARVGGGCAEKRCQCRAAGDGAGAKPSGGVLSEDRVRQLRQQLAVLAAERRRAWAALVLAAMGADHLGHPLTPMPATHRAALAGVDWPTPGQETTR